MSHCVQIQLKGFFRPKVIGASSQRTGNLEIVRPRLSEASKARWKEWVSTLPPMWVRPKLKYTVSKTPTSKIITILEDNSDCEVEVSTVPPMCVRPKLGYIVSITPTGKIITILGDYSDTEDEHLHQMDFLKCSHKSRSEIK